MTATVWGFSFGREIEAQKRIYYKSSIEELLLSFALQPA
jgi:hypothetical protein